jgi:hypothetical protein
MRNTRRNTATEEATPSSQETRTPEQIDANLQAINDRIAKLEELRIARENLARLEAQVLDPSETSSVVNQRHSTYSGPEERTKEIKIKNISTFTLNFNLQRRQDWLLDLRYTFRGAPWKYQTDENKILAALNYLDHTCRHRWYRHVEEKPAEERQNVEDSWPYFEEWTLTLIRNASSLQADIMGQIERASQLPDQDPREFHAYLDTLEQHFPRKMEKERALFFFAKLQGSLKKYIQEHKLHLPEIRDEMVSLATHYWHLLKPNRKRTWTDSTPNSGRDSNDFKRYRYNRSYQYSTAKEEWRQPTGSDGKPYRCYICDATDHLAPRCPKRAKVQSLQSQQYAKQDSENVEESE